MDGILFIIYNHLSENNMLLFKLEYFMEYIQVVAIISCI